MMFDSIPLERRVIRGGQTQGYVKADNMKTFDSRIPQKEYKGSEYAIDYLLEEEEEEAAANSVETNKQNPMCEVEELTSVGNLPNIDDLNTDVDVYDKFDFERNEDEEPALPVFEHREKLMKMIQAYPVIVVKGNTGCGKTTQVPQMILDNYVSVRQHCNIVVTQPRRIAAISVAKRVCKERNWRIGSIVAYQVGLDKTATDDTRLTYCTTGVLLQKLVKAKNMNEYTHVILDEVHERTQDMDFLMLLVRKFQRTVSKNVKIILMSATINTDPYTAYFAKMVNQFMEDPPVIEIGKENNFKVQTYYLDDIEGKLGPFSESMDCEPRISVDSYNFVVKLIQAFDYIDKQEKTGKSAVLVFLPGLAEIENLFEALQMVKENDWWICPLHSTITADEQMKVFKPPPFNNRKIILSTNIAESSITVSDIKYVIDFCLTKSVWVDPSTNLTSLHMCWASKSQCVQRAGRVGRVTEGRVYRLVHKNFFEFFEAEAQPEMSHSSLEITVLKAKELDMGEPKKILAQAMDPPDFSQIEKTVVTLKEVGALLMTVDGEYNECDGDMTLMGKVMALLPLDIRMTKLILLGHVFSVLDEAIIMACSMTMKSMFSRPFKKDLQAYISKLTWADSTCSDPIACCNAYYLWRRYKTSGKFNLSTGGGVKMWANRFFIQLNAMAEVGKLQEEVQSRLRMYGIEETKGPDRVDWGRMKPLILKIVLAGACYPYYYMRSQVGGQVDEREAVKILGGRDPFNTVYLNNFPFNQPGPLYTSAIKSIFEGCGVPRANIKISYDSSSKVYVEFKSEHSAGDDGRRDDRQLSSTIPGKISMAVYRALKLKHHSSFSIEIPMMRAPEANKKMQRIIERSKNNKKVEEKSILPSLSTQCIEITIIQINNPGNFYAQYTELDKRLKLTLIQHALSQTELRTMQNPQLNDICAAPFSDYEMNVMYYRAKVIELTGKVAKVLFIDYGNIESMDVSYLRRYKNKCTVNTDDGPQSINLHDEPPLAFCCTLAQIQPSVIKSFRANWSDQANKEFEMLCSRQSVFAKVYSVVDDIASLELYVTKATPRRVPSWNPNHDEDMINVNQRLVQLGLAEWTEESYLSKLNHDLRLSHQMTDEAYTDYSIQKLQSISSLEQQLCDDQEIESPRRQECRATMKLKGPFSPLEMKVYSCLRSSAHKTVGIETDSVNSVLLDTHPQDPHERMIIAANVGQSPNGDRLTLRYTTILPNIHGLPAFLCLLFAPSVELRIDEDVTRLTGAICGLGYDPETKESYFPENDMEVAFDTVFSMNQIEVINKLRYWLSQLLGTTIEDKMYRNNEYIQNQKYIEKLLLSSLKDLANQNTERVEPSRHMYQWKMVDERHLIYPGMDSDNLIYPLIWGINFSSEGSEAVQEKKAKVFKKNIDMLKEISSGKLPLRGCIVCELCQVTIDNVQSLRMHFHSSEHLQLAKRFNLTV